MGMKRAKTRTVFKFRDSFLPSEKDYKKTLYLLARSTKVT